MRDSDCCFVGAIKVGFILVKDQYVVCVDELGDAKERVAFGSWHDVHIACGRAHVMMEFIHVTCLLLLAGGHAEGLVQLLSCCNEWVPFSVFCCPDV